MRPNERRNGDSLSDLVIDLDLLNDLDFLNDLDVDLRFDLDLDLRYDFDLDLLRDLDLRYDLDRRYDLDLDLRYDLDLDLRYDLDLDLCPLDRDLYLGERDLRRGCFSVPVVLLASLWGAPFCPEGPPVFPPAAAGGAGGAEVEPAGRGDISGEGGLCWKRLLRREGAEA